jgi:hypothetical protein
VAQRTLDYSFIIAPNVLEDATEATIVIRRHGIFLLWY